MRRILFTLLLALTLAPLACKTQTPASASTLDAASEDLRAEDPSSPLPLEAAGKLRVIHTIEWPAGPFGVSLVGVDAEASHAIVLLKDPSASKPGLAIETVSLDSGLSVERWYADEPLARAMVNGYPGFRGMQQGAFNTDLIRYATLLEHIGSWSYREATPPLGVLPSPSGRHIIFATQPADGQDGDWLMHFDSTTLKTSRLDTGLRASYHPSFSPDGTQIAWIGGSSEFAAPGRQIGYVLRMAQVDGRKHVAIPAISELLRTPIWSSDSSTLYAFGKRAREHCLFAVNARTRVTEQLLCHDNNIDIMLSPDTSRALLLLHASATDDSNTQRLVTLDFATGEQIMRMSTSRVQGLGAFGIWIDEERFGLLSELGDTLSIMNSTTGEVSEEIALSTGTHVVRGRHGMKIVGNELIALRQNPASQEVEIVGITIK